MDSIFVFRRKKIEQNYLLLENPQNNLWTATIVFYLSVFHFNIWICHFDRIDLIPGTGREKKNDTKRSISGWIDTFYGWFESSSGGTTLDYSCLYKYSAVFKTHLRTQTRLLFVLRANQNNDYYAFEWRTKIPTQRYLFLIHRSKIV